jgi:hypothetical protein
MSRRELMESRSKRYRQALRTSKKRILDEVCATAGFPRKRLVPLEITFRERPKPSRKPGRGSALEPEMIPPGRGKCKTNLLLLK